MKKILFLLLITGVLAVGALNYHFILLDDGIRILKKAEVTYTDTFIDARGTKKLQLLFKPALVRAGVKEILNIK